MQLFDTHTHFDVADFDTDRQHLAEQNSWGRCTGLNRFLESRFDELIQTHQQLQSWENVHALILPQVYIRFISNSIRLNIYSTRAGFAAA
jgi:Tat protein secretion system quality control protein TatD with DNase activity